MLTRKWPNMVVSGILNMPVLNAYQLSVIVLILMASFLGKRSSVHLDTKVQTHMFLLVMHPPLFPCRLITRQATEKVNQLSFFVTTGSVRETRLGFPYDYVSRR